MFDWLKRPSRIADVAAGMEVVVQGKLVEDRSVAIPGTDVRCVFYWMMTEIWGRITTGKGRKMWIPQEASQGMSGFFLDDGTGRIWVSNVPLQVDLRGGWSRGGPVGKKGTARYVARFLLAGDSLRVKGVVTVSRGSEPGSTLVMRPGQNGRLVLTQQKKGPGESLKK